MPSVKRPPNFMKHELHFKSLKAKTWPDFERLFGPRGACGGCWCMFWKMPSMEFQALTYEGTKAAQKAIVDSGTEPGLLAYWKQEVVGWIAVEPRSKYPRLARSRVLKPVDNQPVWSITCLFVRREFRRRGLTIELLRAAIDHARRHGGEIVEGYPVEPRSGRLPAASAYTGVASAFLRAGFHEVARNSQTRPIYRYEVGG